jgi:hypothetical protein
MCFEWHKSEQTFYMLSFLRAKHNFAAFTRKGAVRATTNYSAVPVDLFSIQSRPIVLIYLRFISISIYKVELRICTGREIVIIKVEALPHLQIYANNSDLAHAHTGALLPA